MCNVWLPYNTGDDGYCQLQSWVHNLARKPLNAQYRGHSTPERGVFPPSFSTLAAETRGLHGSFLTSLGLLLPGMTLTRQYTVLRNTVHTRRLTWQAHNGDPYCQAISYARGEIHATARKETGETDRLWDGTQRERWKQLTRCHQESVRKTRSGGG